MVGGGRNGASGSDYFHCWVGGFVRCLIDDLDELASQSPQVAGVLMF
jgi:hypothetical protein